MGRRSQDVENSDSEYAQKSLASAIQIISEESELSICIFCKTSCVDELTLGPLYYRDGVVTHYFCLLFSAALSQNGADDEGILGFMPEDIMKEVRRSFRLKCIYCNVSGASVGCCNKKCREVFHFPCGLKNGANFQFLGMYESHCARHLKLTNVPIKLKDWSCPICMTGLAKGEKPVTGTCCKSAAFHKECLQRMALNAGYFFKCPMCNSSKKFVHEMRSSGIYVPEQDASWEKDNAFQDLYLRYSKCDAEKCNCSKGREYDANKGNWMLARCRLCGAAGVHRQCGNLDTVANWACEPCRLVEEKAEVEKKKKPAKKKIVTKPVKTVDITASPSRPGPSTAPVRHVSAASANRRVRNGAVNRRSAGRLSTSPVFKLTKVKIDKSCFSYFPHTKESIKRKFSTATCLPDWRNMSLQVNVYNWIPPLKRDKAALKRAPVPTSAAASSRSSQAIQAKPSKRGPPRKRGAAVELPEPVLPVSLTEVVGKAKKKVTTVKTSSPVTKPVYQATVPASPVSLKVTPVKKVTSPVAKKVPPIVLTAVSPLANPPPDCFTTSGRYLPSKRSALESTWYEPIPEKRFKIRTIPPPAEKKKPRFPYVKKKVHRSSWARGVVKKQRKLTREKVQESLAHFSDLNLETPVDLQLTPMVVDLFKDTVEEVAEFPKTPEPTPEEELVFKALGDRLRTELSQESKDAGNIRRRKQVFSNPGLSKSGNEEPEIIKVVYAGKSKDKQIARKLVWNNEGTKTNAKSKAVGERVKPTRSVEGRSRSSAALSKLEASCKETSSEVGKKCMDETENIYVEPGRTTLNKDGMQQGGKHTKPGVGALKEQSEFLHAGNCAALSSMTEEHKATLLNALDTKASMISDTNHSTAATETDTSDSQDLPLSPVKLCQTGSGRFGRQINSTINM